MHTNAREVAELVIVLAAIIIVALNLAAAWVFIPLAPIALLAGGGLADYQIRRSQRRSR